MKNHYKNYKFIQKLIENFEKEIFPWSLIKCEPFLTKNKYIESIAIKKIQNIQKIYWT